MRGVTMEKILEPWNGKERCGVWFEHLIFEVPNMAKEPADSFMMEAGELHVLSERIGEPVAGIWHSHPTGRPQPSKTDYDYHPVGYGMAIVEGGVWRVYDPVSRVLLNEMRLLP